MNIIHCVSDEKFIDGIIDVFNLLQGEHINKYAFFPENKTDGTFKFVKKNADKIVTVDRKKALDYVNGSCCQVLILHNLSTFPIEQLARVAPSVKVLWLAWGYDLYSSLKGHSPFIPIKQYLPLTQKALDNDWFNRLRMLAKRIRWQLLSYNRMMEEGVRRVDFFSGVIPWEYDMMKKNPFFQAKRVDFTYFDLNPFATEERLLSPVQRGNDILIGNSAGDTNNHLDIMEQLSRLNLKENRLILPLSYAGRKRYVSQVIAAGQQRFGRQFVPLNTFIPLTDYQAIIAGCGYAVFAIERQQALGNIWLALWNGLTVFMSKNSPLYHHLRQQGYHIFNIQDDLHLIAEGRQISAEEIADNRRTLLKYDSLEQHLKKVRTLYQLLEQNTQPS